MTTVGREGGFAPHRSGSEGGAGWRRAGRRAGAVVVWCRHAEADSPIYELLGEEENVPVIAEVFSDILSQPELCADKIHPNAQGYQRMADEFFKALKEIGLVASGG